MNLHNNNGFLSNPNNLLKFFKNDIQEFKNSLNCFSLFEDRITEGANFELSDSISIDVGFKYIIKIKKGSSHNYYTLLKLIKLETLFNDSLIDFSNSKNNLNKKSNWLIIKKAFDIKCFLPGKILNPIKNGFSVGVCGFIGFMPKKYALDSYSNLKSVFIINNIDVLKKTFILSQRQIDKTTFRVLFKLSSQLSYISKN
jgi:hypothetical protein|uniref:ribosomal protein S1 n=1 Tax=Cryptomonas pyrenoidifera TaxID=233184 RepID=UPI00226D3F7C|nr:ribosomal protein S1 [Cryptomonas pyrenoidifera]UZP15143.1 ribosomal protein S1 [Cryptomonas pyrenoidifera]